MTKHDDKNIRLSEISDFVFNDLTSKILKCSEIMKSDFVLAGKKIPNHEEKIRNILLTKYLNDDELRNKIGLSNHRFIDEKPVSYSDEKFVNNGRIDIMIVSNDWFDSNNNYYVIECKRLDGNKTLNKKYVEEGILRFIKKPILYTSHYKKNFMMGFIVKKSNINFIMEEINNILMSNVDINMLKKMELKNTDISDSWIADSLYNTGECSILLRSLFYDFSSIIS